MQDRRFIVKISSSSYCFDFFLNKHIRSSKFNLLDGRKNTVLKTLESVFEKDFDFESNDIIIKLYHLYITLFHFNLKDEFSLDSLRNRSVTLFDSSKKQVSIITKIGQNNGFIRILENSKYKFTNDCPFLYEK